MNRMDKVFNELKNRKEKILINYFPIGDSILGDDVEWCGKYFENGTTVLEIGMPYENPVFDGKTVRDSMARAISNTTHEEVFATIKKFRKQHPDNILQIMTYYEIIKNHGLNKFVDLCYDSGVDAVLAPNAPFEEFHELDEAFGKYGLYFLRFTPFHLEDSIVQDIVENSKGYIFLQAVDGSTGQQSSVSPQIRENIKALKEAGVATPIVAGFGISNDQQAIEVLKMGADGIVVGSATIKHIMAGDGEKFIKSLSNVMK